MNAIGWRENSLRFEEKVLRWSASTQPENDVEEFLLYQSVSMAATFERVQRAHSEHLQTRVDNVEATALEEAHDLGSRLFFDPCGPTEVYGSQPGRWRDMRTSWNGKAIDPDDPAKLVRTLNSTAAGCWWMRARWKELRAFLEQPKGFWAPSDRLRSIRLLGRNPVHAIDDERVAAIFAATHALHPVGEAFDDLLTDMGYEAHQKFVKTIKARWTGLVKVREADKARQILLELVDENIAHLESRLKKLIKNPEEQASRSMDSLGIDNSRDGEFFLTHELRFANAAKRGLQALQTYQAKRKKDGHDRDRYDTPGHEAAVLRRAPRATGRDPQPSVRHEGGANCDNLEKNRAAGGAGTIAADPDASRAWPEPDGVDLSWAMEAFVPEGRIGAGGETLAESLEAATATAAVADDIGCEGAGAAEKEAKFTSEPNFDENLCRPNS